jgi:PAS domain S-box-containing protein
MPGGKSKSRRPSAPSRVVSPLEPRLNVALRLEMMLLFLRYIMYVLLLLTYVFQVTAEYTPNLVGITVGAVLQNAWVHFVLYRRRYDLFVHPANFLVHLAKVTLIVALTGAGSSPLVPLYVAIIIGHCMCSTEFKSTYLVTVSCAAALAAVVLGSWFIGWRPFEYPVSFNFFLIFLSGWMMNTMGEMLRSVELDGLRRAQALASSEATLRAILNSTASPIIVCEESELISDVNEGACEFIGLPREELVGRRIRAYLFDDGTLPQKLATLRNKGMYHGEAIVLTAEGDERMVDLHVRSYMHDQQRSFVAMLHDITAAKNLQEAARLTTVRLEQVNRELQQVNQLRSEFYTTIARRLRSPLSAILGFIDMFLDKEFGDITPEQRRALQSCRRSVTRVFGLADEALEAAPAPVAPPAVEADKGTGPAGQNVMFN